MSDADVGVLRLAAFTDAGAGGNPAGVVLDADGLDDARMQAIAAAVGYSETAFVRARTSQGRREYDVRFFTPTAEVPFCGHATIASAVALARRDGPAPLLFRVPAGEVRVRTSHDPGAGHVATLTSVAPAVEVAPAADVGEVLAALRWSAEDLDARLAPRLAFAGSRHLVLAAATRQRLAALDCDFERLGAVSARLGAVTVALVWRESPARLHARNLGPAVGIPEDPATGSAAAAVGAWLLDLREIEPPARFEILQGADMGRPSRLQVEVPAGEPGIRVTGAATPIGTEAGHPAGLDHR